MSLSVTPLCATDVSAVHALATAALPEAWSEASLAALVQNPLALALVARREDKLCGFCFLYLVADEGQIMEVVTAPEVRRQGVGRALLTALMEQAAQRGATYFTLEVRAQNEAARALYASLGFTEDGVRRRYYRNPTDDAILMGHTKNLFLEKGSWNSKKPE